jgi:hypothetical protein
MTTNNGKAPSNQHVIVGKLTAIGKRHITLGAGTKVLLPDQRLLDGIEVGMSLTLVVTRQNGVMFAERIERFDDGKLFARASEKPNGERPAAEVGNPDEPAAASDEPPPPHLPPLRRADPRGRCALP